MRRWLIALLLVVTGSTVIRDIDLGMNIRSGEVPLTRTIVDQSVNGVITKAHVTRIPSPGDVAALLMVAAVHLCLMAVWNSCLSRRSRHVNQRPPDTGKRRRSAIYWAAFTACQAAGIGCLALGAMPPITAFQLASFVALTPGSLVTKTATGNFQLSGAIAFNFVAWFVVRKWKDESS